MWRVTSLFLCRIIFSAVLLQVLLIKVVAADYILPYPSYLPGHKLYRLSRLWDRLNNWWFWGAFVSVKYHLRLSDKYLVESKTLFEYGQYWLASEALARSNQQFALIPAELVRAQLENKDIINFKKIVSDAARKHISILEKLEPELPVDFNWQPEKREATFIEIRKYLHRSNSLRQGVLNEISGL